MADTGNSAALDLTLTQLARESAVRRSRTSYRRADSGSWCSPVAPHVDGCTCQPGDVMWCSCCWDTFLHHITT